MLPDKSWCPSKAGAMSAKGLQQPQILQQGWKVPAPVCINNSSVFTHVHSAALSEKSILQCRKASKEVFVM